MRPNPEHCSDHRSLHHDSLRLHWESYDNSEAAGEGACLGKAKPIYPILYSVLASLSAEPACFILTVVSAA
jgi:hypothetical protein